MDRQPPLHRAAIVAAPLAILLLVAGLLTGAGRLPAAGAAHAVTTASMPSGSPAPSEPAGEKPTIVLVHGAFADASGWNDVVSRLVAKGYPVYAPPNPLRGLASDAGYLAAFLATIEGPLVLVGRTSAAR